MGARRNHYYYIDRYPLGLDATVFISASGSVQTMSWTNDTDYPVLIRGYKIRNGHPRLREVRAVQRPERPEGRDRQRRSSRTSSPPATRTQLTSTLAPGVRKRIEYPVDGKQVWRTVTVYDANGRDPPPDDLLLELRADHRPDPDRSPAHGRNDPDADAHADANSLTRPPAEAGARLRCGSS